MSTDTTGASEIDDLDLAPYEERSEPSFRAYGIALVVLGAIGLAASFTLLVDKFKLLQNPDFTPSCDINPVLSCGSVMVKPQAGVFGFPNPMLGLIGFSVLITMGVLYASGARPRKWLLGGLVLGSLAGLTFVHWLFFQSLYRIGALCPWCMVVWAVTIALGVWTILLSARVQWPNNRTVALLFDVRFLIVVLWYLGIGIAILVRFWYYWKTVL